MAFNFGWMQQLEDALKGEHPALRKGKLPLEFHAPTLPGNKVAVVGAEGHERVNETYRYDVEVVTPLPPEAFQPALFGMSASLLMRTPEHDGRLIQGLVATLEVAGIADRGLGKDLFRYIVTLVPPLWLWTQRRRNRVFQDKTLPELMKQLLEAEKIDYRFKLDLEKYPKRALYYQRDETDYEFFQRVLADSGVYFLFEHAVQDASTNGVLSAVGAGAAIVGGVGSALAGFGVSKVGDAMGAAGKMGQDLTHAVTRLVLGDDDNGTTPLQDFAAINDTANALMKAGIGALAGAAKEAKDWAGKGIEAQTGIDMSDELDMDDGSNAAPGDERIYALSYRRNLRPKSVWTLERDHKEPRSWANRNRKEVIETPKLQLDFHLSLGRKGLGVDGGVSADLALDAPTIAPEKLEQELIGRNVGWLAYPSETHRPNGPFVPVQMHEHLKRSLEQLRQDSTVVEVDTDCRRLAAGYRFRLGKHPSGVLNTEYTVTAMEVRAVDPEMLELATDDPRRERPYIAKLEAVPSKDLVPRPPLPERRKHPMELGTVVRWKESADMVTFNRNEVMVRLGWDTDTEGYERPDPKYSDQQERDGVLCVPVLQPWAGDGYGLQVTPREGMQVVIGYLDAQGDRPIILGCLYSDTKPPPWGGPDAVKVGFRTQSRWPRGTYEDRAIGRTTGWSEISIDDTGNNERVTVKAEKDLSIGVGGDRTETVSGSAAETVAGGLARLVGLDVFDDVRGTLTQTVGRDVERTVSGDEVVTIDGKQTLHVEGPSEVRVVGGLNAELATLNQSIQGAAYVAIGGPRSVTIGSPAGSASEDLRIYGDSTTLADGHLRIRADKGVTLSCGKTVVRLTPDGIYVGSSDVAIAAGKRATVESGEGPLLMLDKQITMAAKNISLTGDSASIKLGSDATIQGSSISLKKGASDSKDSTRSTLEPGKKNVEIRFIDPERVALANKRYHLFYDDVRIEGTTDDEGMLHETVPESLTHCEVLIWHGEFPKSRRSHYIVDIADLPDLMTPDGIRSRLHALGYDIGLGKPSIHASMEEAVRRFQTHYLRKHNLTVTGIVDAATLDALKSEFGH